MKLFRRLDPPRGIIALILASAVSITLVAGVIIAELRPDGITDIEINFFSLIGGAMVAELATYIALAYKRKDEVEEDEDDETSAQ